MKKAIQLVVACGALLVATAGEVQSALIIADPNPDDIAVLKNGLYYAWASPVASASFDGNTLKLPGFYPGWRYATDQELAVRPASSEYGLLPDRQARAVPYWNDVFTHVDADDYDAGRVTSLPNSTSWETVYVLDTSHNPVPEPTSLALLGMGIAGLGSVRLRRKRKAKLAA